jgi:WD40 repeat protein
MQVINLLNEEEVLKYTGNQNSKFLVDVNMFENGDKKYLLSGSEDDCIAIWDVETGGDCSKLKIGNTQSQIIINSVTSNKSGVIAYAGFPDNLNKIGMLSLNIE